MNEILESALNFSDSWDNMPIVVCLDMMVNNISESHVLMVQAPSTQDVIRKVFKLNRAGMNIYDVKFL